MSDIIDLKKKIKDVENLKKIVSIAETEFKKKLNKIEITDLINFINQLNFAKIYNKDINIVNSDIVTTYKNIVSKPKNFDLQEYFKQQINEKSNISLKKYESFQNKEALENPNDSELIKSLILKSDEEWIELNKKLFPILKHNRKHLLSFNEELVNNTYINNLNNLIQHEPNQENYFLF